jgi:hypothetical protein
MKLAFFELSADEGRLCIEQATVGRNNLPVVLGLESRISPFFGSAEELDQVDHLAVIPLQRTGPSNFSTRAMAQGDE